MKMTDFAISLHTRTLLLWPAPLWVFALLLAGVACQDTAGAEKIASADPLPATTLPTVAVTIGPTSQPADSSSVMVYIKMVIDKKYGLLAHLVGNRDVTERQVVYDARNHWWINPLIAYADAPMIDADVIGHADALPIIGLGTSSHVGVCLSLTPHADISIRTNPPSDGIKGVITVSISTVDEFYDGAWTEMVRTKDRPIRFTFDTCDPAARLQEVMHQIRNVPSFSLERYTRGHEKWEPRSRWPAAVQSGDARTVIYGTDARLDVTGYRYVRE